MKSLVIVLAVILAAHALPYNTMPMYPQTSGQQFGNQYGGQEHNMGSSGFGQRGHQTGSANEFHNRGQKQSNFRQIKEGSSSSSHDIGGSSQFGSAGGQSGGFNNYNRGQSGYGQQGGSSFMQG